VFTRFVLLCIAAFGSILAVGFAAVGDHQWVPRVPTPPPSASAAPRYLEAVGIVEHCSASIPVSAPRPGIVKAVMVRTGMRVNAGDPLFELDDRDLRANLALRHAELRAATDAYGEARESLDEALEYIAPDDESTIDKDSASADAVEASLLVAARAQLGLDAARLRIQEAAAKVQAVAERLELLIVRAPLDGDILQVNARRGERASSGAALTPTVHLGSSECGLLRVDVDEAIAWRFQWARAIALAPGSQRLRTPLMFVRVEPEVADHRLLVRTATHRVGSRSVQVIYMFSRNQLPAADRQALRVFIEVAAEAAVTIPGRRANESP
jgi:HlyD family secretion protein